MSRFRRSPVWALGALCLVAVSLTVQSAQDHNSSRSNKTASATAPSDVEKMLELSRADALEVAKAMIAADQRDGYAGDYEITVTVGVSVARARRPR